MLVWNYSHFTEGNLEARTGVAAELEGRGLGSESLVMVTALSMFPPVEWSSAPHLPQLVGSSGEGRAGDGWDCPLSQLAALEEEVRGIPRSRSSSDFPREGA